VRTWRLEGIGEVIRGPVSAPMAKVVHEDLLIGVMEAGLVKASYRGATHALENGAIILGQPGEGVAFEPVFRKRHPIRVCMRCPLPLLLKVAHEVAGRGAAVPFFPGFVTADPQLAALFLGLQRALEGRASRLETSSRFHDLLAWVVRFHTSPPPTWRGLKRERALVRRVREYLDVHYADHVALQDLARLVDLSAFHLNRVFRAEIGLPPHAYQTQVRIAVGKALIAQGVTIDRVAADLGFFDQSHFTHHFKRLLGFTPGAYRQSVLGRRSDHTSRVG
jgi:AraC-like DNA-binding protein